MDILEIAILAIGSAFWPILIAVDLVALRTRRPAALLGWFLAAGLLTTISEGLLIVFVLEGTRLASRTDRSVGGGVDLIAGAVALLVASVLRRRSARRGQVGHEPARRETPQPSWTERAVTKGGAYAFAAGVVLNLFPGILPFLALRDIAALSHSDGVKVLLVVGLYVCMFALVEVPLVGLVLAPDRAEPLVRSLNDWLDRNGMRVVTGALALVGLFLVVRGIVELVSA
jgi:hypothetical protein